MRQNCLCPEAASKGPPELWDLRPVPDDPQTVLQWKTFTPPWQEAGVVWQVSLCRRPPSPPPRAFEPNALDLSSR